MRRMPPILLRFWVALLALSALSLVYTAAMTHHLHTKMPYGLPLLYGQDFGWDLLVYKHRFSMLRSANFWTPLDYPLTYPATLGIALALLYRLSHPLVDYLLLLVAALLGWAWWLVRKLMAEGITAAWALGFALCVAALAWPVWIEIDTANIEGLVAITLGAGMIAMAKRRWGMAATLVGLAGAMKIFPLLLLGVLLARRRYKEFSCGLAVAGMATLGSLAILGPNVLEAQRQIDRGFVLLTNNFGLSVAPDALDANHSLYTVVKAGVVLAHYGRLHPEVAPATANPALLAMPYRIYLVSFALLGLAAYFLRICSLPLLNQMLALTICAVLLPPVSMDYTLLHLLVPFGLLCAFATAHELTNGLAICFGCFALLFSAGTFLSARFGFAGEARALTLLILLIAVMRYRFADRPLDEVVE